MTARNILEDPLALLEEANRDRLQILRAGYKIGEIKDVGFDYGMSALADKVVAGHTNAWEYDVPLVAGKIAHP